MRRERPRLRRTGADAAASGLRLAARFATGAGVRLRSRRTDPEAATNGLALAARFAVDAGLRVFLLDLRSGAREGDALAINGRIDQHAGPIQCRAVR